MKNIINLVAGWDGDVARDTGSIYISASSLITYKRTHVFHCQFLGQPTGTITTVREQI